MHLSETKPADKLNAWRDAVRAAELADRLAANASAAADAADVRAVKAVARAGRAEQAASAAARTSERAAATAVEAAALAKEFHENALLIAARIVNPTRAVEVDARRPAVRLKSARTLNAQTERLRELVGVLS